MPKVSDLVEFLQENYASNETVSYTISGTEDVRSECGDQIDDQTCEATLEKHHEILTTSGVSPSVYLAYRLIQN